MLAITGTVCITLGVNV